ncbi:zinc finger FYVE domain-containing protein 26 homolog isoform X2 [Agrilus planipennis]|uniref:Zinc finger FYVE domain-containing protein 26 homolog isoform X2 n=1 Tax=Agrilus planipennis TaxID=224129 RepID=A0A1W4XBB5_AGRPL|nr:zinc finger FYVE domain-containing protein 26 homolog isoform X2 [Agrilus planipennis]
MSTLNGRKMNFVKKWSHSRNIDNNEFCSDLMDLIQYEMFDEENNYEELVLFISDLLQEKKIQKDLLYLTLMTQKDCSLLSELIKKFPQVLDLKEPVSIYNYSIKNEKHWLLEVIENEELHSTFSEKIIYKIRLLQNINITNNCASYKSLEELNTSHFDLPGSNGFFKLYCDVIKRAKKTVDIYKIIEKDINLKELLLLCCQNSLLNVFFSSLDLTESVLWPKILTELESLNNETDITTFKCFIIIYTVICSLQLCKNIPEGNHFKHKDVISSKIEEAKQHLMSLIDIKWQTIVLENIFVLMFLKSDSHTFFCQEKEIRLLLTFLKTCIEDIQPKHLYNRNSESVKRINELSKCVTDAFWRFEIVTEENSLADLPREKDLISRMLASPESLINICLKQNSFRKANQVIKVFSLQDTDLAKEIFFVEKLCDFKEHLEQTLRRKILMKKQQLSNESNVSELVNNFFHLNENLGHLTSLSVENTNSALQHLNSKNNKFMNILDLAVIQPDNHEGTEELLNVAVSHNTLNPDVVSPYSEFCKTLLEIFHLVNNGQQLFSVRQILLASEIDLDVKKYIDELETFSKLSSAAETFLQYVNINASNSKLDTKELYKCFLQIQTLCLQNTPNEQHLKYLTRLLNYLKAFFRVFHVNQNRFETAILGKNPNLFDLLKHRRVDIIYKLICDMNLEPCDFERSFTKMKLDVVYHVAASYFPQIHISAECDKAVSTENTLSKPDKATIAYIQKRNWLLAYLIKNIHSVENTEFEISEVRIKNYTNFTSLDRIQYLKVVFENNQHLTVLYNKVDQKLVEHFCNKRIVNNNDFNLLSSQLSTESLETGEEIMEGKLKNTDWKYLFNILQSLTERQLKENANLACLRDNILFNLVSDKFEPNSYEYVKYIKEDRLRQNCIKNNFKHWPGRFCIEVMKNEISMYKQDDCDILDDFESWCEKIDICEQLNFYFQMFWSDVFQLCETSQEFVLRQLLTPSKIDLLLKFLKIYKPQEEVLVILTENYFSKLFIYETDFKKIKEIFEMFPPKYAKNLFIKLLDYVRKLEHLEFLMSHLSNIDDSSEMIKNINISLKILSCFDESEREQFWCLIRDPLCMIEILIMNTMLEKLGQVIRAIQQSVNECSPEDKISWKRIDELLRIYAEKSLDFRVVIQSKSPATFSENKLMESMDSSQFGTNKRDFLMPDDVPSKSEWVKNEEVSECMCCSETAFSMFNRRHHCRRCGRVICGSCSTKRMPVPTYGDIRVRVCKDCYQQTFYDSPSNYSIASVKSIDYDYWQLTDNESQNKYVRNEFSFEHAPSVYLCLAILKYHSPSDEYTKFLLDQCHKLLKLLYPIPTEVTQEIDYFLVIKMLKSLAIAAKMQSFYSGHEGSALADRILSQAELLELLIDRGCLRLISSTSINPQTPYIDSSTIRRLRDKLLEDEQWNLALEVSTKAGLDNTGVFAAWGKSCLKAGSLKIAREKFQRCFDKTSYYENSLDFSCSFNESLGSRKKTYTISGSNYDNKPSRNPPLLNEIIQILEGNSCRFDSTVLKDCVGAKHNQLISSTVSLNSSNTTCVSTQIDAPICILSKLQNLGKLIDGNYGDIFESNISLKSIDLGIKKSLLNPLFYDECVYYLFRYGSHISLLEFYIRHDEIEEALQYILDYRLAPEIFIEVYTLCLKDGNIYVFLEKMSKLDSTLDVWKNYLRHICRYFEQQSMLHSLYQLQQFMGDYVRAAMTSIKFYKADARSYIELKSRMGFLQKAQDHLKQELEQEQWVEVATVRKSSSASQHSFEAKSITNPSLVMKIDSKSIDRHINTIWRQMEVTKFLAECETNGIEVMKLLPEILPFANKETVESKGYIPTLFGSYYEKVQLAVLCIICGSNVEDGFGIAFRIIQDYKLNPVKVYCQSGKQLAKAERYIGLAQLVNCIRSSGVSDSTIIAMCDEMLILAIQTLTKANTTGPQLDGLIKLVTDRNAKISAYIETKQLKSAYLLAVKHKRMGDIRRILKEAEYLNQPTIKALCQKVLQANSHSPSHSKD